MTDQFIALLIGAGSMFGAGWAWRDLSAFPAPTSRAERHNVAALELFDRVKAMYSKLLFSRRMTGNLTVNSVWIPFRLDNEPPCFLIVSTQAPKELTP